jgi:protein-L-isoaspartate O-methyltransferase
VNWEEHAIALAAQTTHPVSRWRPVIASLPRHVFVPRWWEWTSGDQWTLHDGQADRVAWMEKAYENRSLVTQIGSHHADHARPNEIRLGRPTSSSTMASLVVRMLRHGMINDGMDVLEVGTGSGYGTAALAVRLGDGHVTSVDVDEYLTKVAAERLDAIGMHPRLTTIDATGPLPATYDRIVSTVAVRPIPASWLAALRPGGRLVTSLINIPVILTADKTEDGGAEGVIEWDRAGFMHTRTGPGYPPGLDEQLAAIEHADGDEVWAGRYPVINVDQAWELQSVLEITAPGIQHRYEETDGARAARMIHADGSWARATAHGTDTPVVRQGGPRRLWDIFDEVRDDWLDQGYFQLYGARVRIEPDGVIHLRRGRWEATIF